MKTKIQEVRRAIREEGNIYLECMGEMREVTGIEETELELNAITGSFDRFNRRSWSISNIDIDNFLKQIEDHKNCVFPKCNNCDICKDGN